VANSRASAHQLQLEHVPSREIAVIPNGLDFVPCTPRASRSLRKVTVVANLRKIKGLDVLIDASAAILQRFPDARFQLIGDGPERRALASRAAALGVGGAFRFAGVTDDVPARLADTDIFVLPSRSESFPNAILEAMAAGLPIVASGVGGILELIADGRTGWLVPPGKHAPLADRVIHVMANPSEGAAIGAAARADALARFSFDRMVAGFEHLYTTELARHGVAPAGRSQLAVS
jgi:glycosyltransferase involved in cell wall biosynthesis